MFENFSADLLGVPFAIALLSALAGFFLRGGNARERKVLQRENQKLKSVLAQIMVDEAHARNAR